MTVNRIVFLTYGAHTQNYTTLDHNLYLLNCP